MKKIVVIFLFFNILALCIFVQPIMASDNFEKDFFVLKEWGYRLDSVGRHDGMKCIWVIYNVAGGKIFKFIPAIHTSKVFYIFRHKDVTCYFTREAVEGYCKEKWLTEEKFYSELLKAKVFLYNFRAHKFGKAV